MAINFPDSPTTGETFQQADRAWQWDGEKWKSTGTTSSSTVGATVIFEGATDDAYETTLTVVDPTSDRTITLPNASGTVTLDGAPAASPTFTGVPAAPTAAADTNTTQVATTAFVQTELGDLAGPDDENTVVAGLVF